MTTVFFFLLGLAAGSFLNVVAMRYPSRDYRGRSRCDFCRTPLKWQDIIPVVSFLVAGGKCRYCGKKISWQYPVVELASGVLFALQPPFLLLLAGGAFLLIAAIDARLGIIPDGITAFIGLLGIARIILNPDIWVSHIAAGIAGFLFLWGLAQMRQKNAMGFGDVKLAGAIGLLLGIAHLGIALVFAFIVGGLWASLLVLRKKKTIKDTLAFGPFLSLGSIVAILFGNGILNTYF